jgi:pimeloyl-ACP methyl ester carboxylesterase
MEFKPQTFDQKVEEQTQDKSKDNFEILNALEEQFAHPERVRLGGEEVNLYDIAPKKLKFETPTVFAPGFSATPIVHEPNIVGIAKDGRRVIAVDSPQGLERPTVTEQDAAGHAEVELAKLSSIMEALNERGIEKTDGVAHSEGGVYLILAAWLNSDKFRNIVLVEPGGMIGKDNVFRLVKGMANELVGQFKDEAKRTDLDRQPKKLQSPMLPLRAIGADLRRSWGSVKAIAESDIIEMLKDLKDRGIHVSIIHGVDDKVFPMDRVQKELGPDAITGFYSVRGGHNEVFLRPEQYTGAISAALDALDAKSKKEEAARSSSTT